MNALVMQGAKLVGTALEQSKNYLQSSGVDHAGSSSDPTHILKFSHKSYSDANKIFSVNQLGILYLV